MIDYKKLIKGRETRIKIMQLFNWVPDKVMLSLQYRLKTGRKLNWDNPARFTEKLQVYKILSRDSKLMAQCADKADVRSFVEGRGLSDILVPIIGVYTSVDQIDWGGLPDQFVIKDTLGGGGNSVIVCTDKSKMDKDAILHSCSDWIGKEYKHAGREHVYDKKKHRIIIERYLDASKEVGGLVDYKFFCFDGKPVYMYVISDRKLGKDAEFGIYDMEFQILPYKRVDERPPSHTIEKPKNFDKMLEIAETLSKGFPEVRVDLYNIGGSIYFGEMTFFDGSGYMNFNPDEFDFIMGKEFVLPKTNNVP